MAKVYHLKDLKRARPRRVMSSESLDKALRRLAKSGKGGDAFSPRDARGGVKLNSYGELLEPSGEEYDSRGKPRYGDNKKYGHGAAQASEEGQPGYRRRRVIHAVIDEAGVGALVTAVWAGIFLILAIIFVSANLTGFAVKEFAGETTSFYAMWFFVLGLFLSFVYFRIKKTKKEL
jgi:hypothetical protein